MKRKRYQYFVGITKGVALNTGKQVYQSFRCLIPPDEKSHGNLFAAVIGPFRTKRGADFMAKHGQGNPHLRCVADAERIANREV